MDIVWHQSTSDRSWEPSAIWFRVSNCKTRPLQKDTWWMHCICGKGQDMTLQKRYTATHAYSLHGAESVLRGQQVSPWILSNLCENPPLAPILSQINQVYALKSYVFEIRCKQRGFKGGLNENKQVMRRDFVLKGSEMNWVILKLRIKVSRGLVCRYKQWG